MLTICYIIATIDIFRVCWYYVFDHFVVGPFIGSLIATVSILHCHLSRWLSILCCCYCFFFISFRISFLISCLSCCRWLFPAIWFSALNFGYSKRFSSVACYFPHKYTKKKKWNRVRGNDSENKTRNLKENWIKILFENANVTKHEQDGMRKLFYKFISFTLISHMFDTISVFCLSATLIMIWYPDTKSLFKLHMTVYWIGDFQQSYTVANATWCVAFDLFFFPFTDIGNENSGRIAETFAARTKWTRDK